MEIAVERAHRQVFAGCNLTGQVEVAGRAGELRFDAHGIEAS